MATATEIKLPVIVLGAGGHAAVLIDALQITGRVILGCLAPGNTPAATGPLGVEILGNDGILARYAPDAVDLVNGIGATDTMASPGGTVRRNLQLGLRQRGFIFASVIHPAATIGDGCDIAAGTQIMAGAVVQTGSRIGAGSIVNTGARIDHDCTVGELVHIAPGVTLCGDVTIGDGAFIGAGATVIPGIEIGAGARIGAGMTILADVPVADRLSPNDTTVWHGPDEPEEPFIRLAATIP